MIRMGELHIITCWEMLQRKMFFVSLNEEPKYVETEFDKILEKQANHICRLSNT